MACSDAAALTYGSEMGETIGDILPEAAYKLPRAVQFVDEVPITASGKIMRRLLKNFDDGTR